jgi:hypothetical protein
MFKCDERSAHYLKVSAFRFQVSIARARLPAIQTTTRALLEWRLLRFEVPDW